jgi:GAF domain-containing protein
MKSGDTMLDGTTVVHDLQRLRDEGHLSDALLRNAVKQVHRADPRYDWVGVYLFNEADNELWLHNYVGTATEHAKIPVGTGVCGTAVAEKTNQIVGDVTEVENYLACDPNVRSEIVVLIRAGDEIFGQIDIDSSEEHAFTEEDEKELSAIADKLAEQIAAERR